MGIKREITSGKKFLEEVNERYGTELNANATPEMLLNAFKVGSEDASFNKTDDDVLLDINDNSFKVILAYDQTDAEALYVTNENIEFSTDFFNEPDLSGKHYLKDVEGANFEMGGVHIATTSAFIVGDNNVLAFDESAELLEVITQNGGTMVGLKTKIKIPAGALLDESRRISEALDLDFTFGQDIE